MAMPRRFVWGGSTTLSPIPLVAGGSAQFPLSLRGRMGPPNSPTSRIGIILHMDVLAPGGAYTLTVSLRIQYRTPDGVMPSPEGDLCDATGAIRTWTFAYAGGGAQDDRLIDVDVPADPVDIQIRASAAGVGQPVSQLQAELIVPLDPVNT